MYPEKNDPKISLPNRSISRANKSIRDFRFGNRERLLESPTFTDETRPLAKMILVPISPALPRNLLSEMGLIAYDRAAHRKLRIKIRLMNEIGGVKLKRNSPRVNRPAANGFLR